MVFDMKAIYCYTSNKQLRQTGSQSHTFESGLKGWSNPTQRLIFLSEIQNGTRDYSYRVEIQAHLRLASLRIQLKNSASYPSKQSMGIVTHSFLSLPTIKSEYSIKKISTDETKQARTLLGRTTIWPLHTIGILFQKVQEIHVQSAPFQTRFTYYSRNEC